MRALTTGSTLFASLSMCYVHVVFGVVVIIFGYLSCDPIRDIASCCGSSVLNVVIHCGNKYMLCASAQYDSTSYANDFCRRGFYY
jgi:hypothetical protein